MCSHNEFEVHKSCGARLSQLCVRIPQVRITDHTFRDEFEVD